MCRDRRLICFVLTHGQPLIYYGERRPVIFFFWGGEGHEKGFDHSLSLFVAQKTKIANFHLNSVSILFYFTFLNSNSTTLHEKLELQYSCLPMSQIYSRFKFTPTANMVNAHSLMRWANVTFTMFAIGANLNLLYTCHIGKHAQIQLSCSAIKLRRTLVSKWNLFENRRSP